MSVKGDKRWREQEREAKDEKRVPVCQVRGPLTQGPQTSGTADVVR